MALINKDIVIKGFSYPIDKCIEDHLQTAGLDVVHLAIVKIVSDELTLSVTIKES